MPLKLFQNRIQKAFSSSARSYDDLSAMQYAVGQDLLRKIPRKKMYPRILDIGMGTGRLTHELSSLFPRAQLVGIDFAQGMLDLARENYSSFSPVCGDAAALPFQAEVFDLVVSNLAYQWVDDLPSTFSQCYRSLRRGGILCLAVFSRETLKELFTCLQESLLYGNGEQELGIQRLPTAEQFTVAIKGAGFSSLVMEQKILSSYFVDMFALVRWLKDTGANIRGNNMFLGKSRLTLANAYYQKHYSHPQGIYASFETIWITASKR
jgi:malonyl-CoA O-methyltransferase